MVIVHAYLFTIPPLVKPEFCHQTNDERHSGVETGSGSPFFVTNNIEYRDGFRVENTSKKTRSRSRRQKIGGGEERGLRTKWRGKSRPPTANKASQNGMALRVRSKVAYRSSILLLFPSFGRVIVSAFQFRAERSFDRKSTRTPNEHLSVVTRARRTTLLLAGISTRSPDSM